MGSGTGNYKVVTNLQSALQAFLSDHRKGAENDPEWIKQTAATTPEEQDVSSRIPRLRSSIPASSLTMRRSNAASLAGLPRLGIALA